MLAHNPVLLNEVIEYLNPQSGKLYIDCTFGAGGYTKAILEHANCSVYAIDRDETVVKYVEDLKNLYPKRFNFRVAEFAALAKIAPQSVDGIVFDIGISSMQVDNPARGFSFMHDADLDMRMNRNDSMTAFDIVNGYSERELANLIFQYGGEKKSRRIAAAVVKKREIKKIETTFELRETIYGAVGHYNDDINPATRTFQAIRIVVNDELGQLQKGLEAATSILSENGRIIVVTFHSLEDKIVKDYFNKLCGEQPNYNRHHPKVEIMQKNHIEFRKLHKKIIAPSDEEVKRNPRSRSAKLRAIEKALPKEATKPTG